MVVVVIVLLDVLLDVLVVGMQIKAKQSGRRVDVLPAMKGVRQIRRTDHALQIPSSPQPIINIITL